MQPVDKDDAEKFKVYLSLFNQQLDNLQLDQDPLGHGLTSERENANMRSTKNSNFGHNSDHQEEEGD